MAQLIPMFDIIVNGTLTASGPENWIDLTSALYSAGVIPSAVIPSGKQIWIAYITCISQDKNATFELRPSLPTKSSGNITDTTLRGFAAVPSGESRDLDVYYNGAITSLAPTNTTSTGVEKLWLRIKSGSGSAATYDYILYCTLY
jgi:hypothetical protein